MRLKIAFPVAVTLMVVSSLVAAQNAVNSAEV